MTLGDKIAKLRKEYNYTQEQLGELLGVSRQTVSKWESNTAYPETSRLIEIGRIFCCSMDYLLTDNEAAEAPKSGDDIAKKEIGVNFSFPNIKERKSEKLIFGMPLYHIGKNACGFFALGVKAEGVFSIGLFSKGIVSFGVFSLGLLSFGAISAGVLAFGSFALGLIAIGAIALGLFAAGAVGFGIVSFGALALGCFSSGALAIGKYIAIGDEAQAMIAVGLTRAQGLLYQHIGALQTADTELIGRLLDENVPAVLAWARKLFELFM